MPRHIPFYPELLEKEGTTTNEILLYGLIEAAAFNEGYCYASSEYMAKQLGVAPGTIKNLLSSLSKKGWVSVEVEGNKRIAITPLLGLSVKQKNDKKSVTPELRSVENSAESVTPELRYRHARMTLASRYDDALNRDKTEVGIIINNNIIKENNKRKENVKHGEPAKNEKPARLDINRKDFETDSEYEKAFYKWNTYCLGEN